MRLEDLEKKIAYDRYGLFTILALFSVIGIFVNSFTLHSPFLGMALSLVYFILNSVFLGHVFFQSEPPGFRVAFGFLLVIMLIALGGASIIIASAVLPIRFDMIAVTAILVMISMSISILNRVFQKVCQNGMHAV